MSPYSSSSSAAFSSSPAPNEHQSALARESHLARTGLAVGKGRVAPLQAAASLTSRPGTVLWTSPPAHRRKDPFIPCISPVYPTVGPRAGSAEMGRRCCSAGQAQWQRGSSWPCTHPRAQSVCPAPAKPQEQHSSPTCQLLEGLVGLHAKPFPILVEGL